MSIKVMPLMLRLLTDIMRQLMCVREIFFPFYPDRLWYTFTAMARIPSKYIVKVTFLHSRGSEYNVINRKQTILKDKNDVPCVLSKITEHKESYRNELVVKLSSIFIEYFVPIAVQLGLESFHKIVKRSAIILVVLSSHQHALAISIRIDDERSNNNMAQTKRLPLPCDVSVRESVPTAAERDISVSVAIWCISYVRPNVPVYVRSGLVVTKQKIVARNSRLPKTAVAARQQQNHNTDNTRTQQAYAVRNSAYRERCVRPRLYPQKHFFSFVILLLSLASTRRAYGVL